MFEAISLLAVRPQVQRVGLVELDLPVERVFIAVLPGRCARTFRTQFRMPAMVGAGRQDPGADKGGKPAISPPAGKDCWRTRRLPGRRGHGAIPP